MITCTRYHDFSAGHRVFGHEGKCQNLHGHNYRVHFECMAPKLDSIGRVVDFSCIKELLCDWIEENWDHKFLIWEDDPLAKSLNELDETVVFTDFNPTAENMAFFLLKYVGPAQFHRTGIQLIKVIVEETRKCSATARYTDDLLNQ